MFFTPNPHKRAVRLLAEAENSLQDAEAALENAKAVAVAFRARVTRLKSELGQPAPTKCRESVTQGDITNALAISVAASPQAVLGASIADINAGLSRTLRRNS